jgi:hypothetical protein
MNAEELFALGILLKLPDTRGGFHGSHAKGIVQVFSGSKNAIKKSGLSAFAD